MSDLEHSVNKTTVGESVTEEKVQKNVQNAEEHSEADVQKSNEYSLNDDRRVETVLRFWVWWF